VVGRRKGRSEGRLERNETSMASGVERLAEARFWQKTKTCCRCDCGVLDGKLGERSNLSL